MSFIRCPICGKDSVASSFDPSELDRDIYVRDVHGKGRGKGFEPGPDISVLGDDIYTPKIIDRCFELLNLCKGKGIITQKTIETELNIGIPTLDKDLVVPYSEMLRVQDNQLGRFETVNASLKQEFSSLESSTVSYFELNELKQNYADFGKKYISEKTVDLMLLLFA